MKKLLIVLVLVVAAWFVWKTFFQSPESKICDRVADLCGDAKVDVGECVDGMEEAGDLIGDGAMDRMAECVEDADTCMEAAGCMAGAMMSGSLGDFARGFERGAK